GIRDRTVTGVQTCALPISAILAVNQHAVPYGGIELARLFDSDQRVVSNVGGRRLATFGVLVRDASAREVLFSQRARDQLPPRPRSEERRVGKGGRSGRGTE